MIEEIFEGCILGGAIGDAWGSSYENEKFIDESKTFYLGGRREKNRDWSITDDTQLTLATCEALNIKNFDAAELASQFLKYYKAKKIVGIGSSTLKSILDLEAGIHWMQSGRKGEFAAGNGAAMRIAPLGFFNHISREDVYNACRITHSNDEAYTGALAVYLAIRSIIDKEWNGNNNLLDILIFKLPDTKVKDRLIEINNSKTKTTISEISTFGNDGYVVNSVPFAIFSATKIFELGMTNMFEEIIKAGGDTDTNSSIAGQISGALIGLKNIPENLLNNLKSLNEYSWIKRIVDETKFKLSKL
jgi:ADP-ribosyl-[dinitrogen reductase] hydrolase